MAYSSASSVARLTKNLLGPERTFSTSTCPSVTEVDNWLSSGCSIIEATLAGHKYGVPVAQGTVVYGWISDLETLYGAAMAEMSRTNVTLAPGERTRGQVFWEMFWQQLNTLVSGSAGDLTLVGLTRTSQGSLYAGGISIAEKQAYETDTDRVMPRFNRGQFKAPGTMDPTGTTAS